MKRFFYLVLIATLFIGCTNDTTITPISSSNTLKISLEQSSRVQLNAEKKSVWSAGDMVSVFYHNSEQQQWAFTGKTGDRTATLEKVYGIDNSITMPNIVAVYPYTECVLNADNSTLSSLTLSYEQSYLADSFGINSSPMVAIGTEDNLKLRHICGWVKLQLTGENKSVKRIALQGNNNEQISGRVDINLEDATAVFSTKDPLVYYDVTLECGDGVALSEEPTDFYIALLPMTFEKGFSAKIYYTDNTLMFKSTNNKVVINRNTIQPMESFEYIDQRMAERAALIEIYNSLNGQNWTNSGNWCSDRPVAEWYGVNTNEMGLVIGINLAYNNISGDIPETIKELTFLQNLDLSGNKIPTIPAIFKQMPTLKTLNMSNCQISAFPEDISAFKHLTNLYLSDNIFDCEIPENIGTLTNLELLYLGSLTAHSFGVGLKGEIPASIGNLTNLQKLDISHNKLTGEIPASMGNLTNLEQCILNNNRLSGKIHPSIMELKCWPNYWFWIISQDYSNGGGISNEGLVIPAPKFNEQTIDGATLDYSIYSNNEYTILYHYYDWCPYSNSFTPTLMKLYEGYKNKGLGVVAFSDNGTIESHNEYAQIFKTTWPYILLTDRDCVYSYLGLSPNVDVVDKNGYVVFNHIHNSRNDLAEFLLDKLGEPDEVDDIIPESYTSSDYSSHGKVSVLQQASIGNGIDLILMGDGFTDRLIVDDTYDNVIQSAYDKFFSIEPYKSFKNLFNVYSVTVVSQNENYGDGFTTALEGWFGEGTATGGNDATAISYALNAVEESRMNDAIIVVMMNSKNFAGTCYMYNPTLPNDYGSGTTVSYFPIGTDSTQLEQLLHHETNGHGFAKLADEYAYEYNGAVPSDYMLEVQSQYNDFGWFKNVDFTANLQEILWSKFITDSRYSSENIGAYEGGLTYWTGVWRPTENSIMRDNIGGFNAPSREAIYYRIHKLAYGDSWVYNYEDFVTYDAINRKSAATQAAAHTMVLKPYEPTTPPIIVGKNWREALEKE